MDVRAVLLFCSFDEGGAITFFSFALKSLCVFVPGSL